MSLIEEALKKRQSQQAAAARDTSSRSAATKTNGFDTTVASAQAAPAVAGPRIELGNPANRKQVNREALRQAGLLPPEHESRQIELQFRTIKRPLIRKAFSEEVIAAGDHLQRSVMVSSALPGDGKTFTTLNLALSMARERDHGVILVDGDVAKPHMSKLFNASYEQGLLDVLQHPEMSVESVLLPTDISGLTVLPVGRQSEQATELLASARMREIIQDLVALDPNGIVLVDSPPILLTSEARVLASLFGQVVLVVRAGHTPQQAVLDAIELLGEGTQVNLVLNQALHASEGSYYGYGSRYGYGYGANSDLEAP
jgi:protein-tyrosine kinase